MKGRALLNITYPLPEAEWAADLPPYREPRTLEEQWTDAPFLLNNFLACIGRNGYLAEGYPSRFVNLGPGFLAAMIGGTYRLAKDTVWFGNAPVVEDYARDLEKIRAYRDGDGWRLVTEMTRYFAENSHGRYITSISDIGGTLDVAASLRGTERLLTDLYDEPEGVLALAEKIDRLWIEAYEALYELIKPYQDGVDTWHNLFCDKPYYTLQCDFCSMISPDQFDRFVLPSLRRHCDWLGHAEYHLDGPGEVCHVPSLLSIPNLDAIQWVAGDGAAPGDDDSWFPMYRQIQEAGKNLILVGLRGREAYKFLERLDGSRLFMGVYCDSREEAERVLEFAEAHGTR